LPKLLAAGCSGKIYYLCAESIHLLVFKAGCGWLTPVVFNIAKYGQIKYSTGQETL